MLSEISQTEKDKYRMISYVESKTKQNKLIDTENRSVVARGQGWGWEKWERGSKGINSQL